MSVINVSGHAAKAENNRFFALGFRPFFTVATIFSMVSIFQWLLIYSYAGSLPAHSFSVVHWHAHEMLYGFCLAVIAGFLLTAVGNWTGQVVLAGAPLGVLLLLWIAARILFSFGSSYIKLAAFFDLSFVLFLLFAITRPIIRCKQWGQSGVIAKVFFLFLGNLLFYLAATGIYPEGFFYSIYGGLLLVIGLIMAIGRRVIPFFIEKGLKLNENIFQPRWLDRLMLLVFVLFFIAVLCGNSKINAIFSGLLFLLLAYRLVLWYQKDIWQHSLLWSLYLSKVFLLCGFALYTLALFNKINMALAWHAFSYGCIGLITLSMMARVTLGHGGGDIRNPQNGLKYSFSLLIIGAVIRVFMPIFLIPYYTHIILISQLIWIFAFAVLLFNLRKYWFC